MPTTYDHELAEITRGRSTRDSLSLEVIRTGEDPAGTQPLDLQRLRRLTACDKPQIDQQRPTLAGRVLEANAIDR